MYGHFFKANIAILLLWRIGWKKSQCACNTGPLIRKNIYIWVNQQEWLLLEKKSYWYEKAGVSNASNGCRENQRSIITQPGDLAKKCFVTVVTPRDISGLASCCSDWSTEEGMTVCRMVDIRAGKLIGLQCQLWLWLTRIVCRAMHCVGRSCMCDVWCVPDDKNWATNPSRCL